MIKEYNDEDDLYHQAMLEEEYQIYVENGGKLPFGTWFLDMHNTTEEEETK